MTKESLLDPAIVHENMRAVSLPDRAYQTIRKTILSGHIKAGEWLRQRDLAQELGVGTATVRQALCRLADEGLVLTEPYKGFRAAILSVEEMTDRNGILRALTGLAVEVAAPRISEEDLAHMRELLPQTFTAEADPVAAHGAHDAFHWIAFKASGREHLIRLLDQFWDSARWQVTMRHNTPDELREWARMCKTYNTMILDALEARDGKRASDAFAHFWEDDLELVLGLIARMRPPSPEE